MQAGPDFICVGAQKAGTQWLYDQLSWHPAFWMPPVKEFHYLDRGSFDRHRRAARSLRRRAAVGLPLLNAVREKRSYRPLAGRDLDFLDRYAALLAEDKVDLDGYARLFEGKGGDIAGDITPGYSRLDADDVARFATRFPAARVLYIARDPIERLWSHLMMTARRNKSLERITRERTLKFARRPVVRLRCTNTEVVRRWRSEVGADRFGLFLFDDIRDDPVAARRAILAFLGADPALPSGRLAPDFNRKSRERKLAMPDDVRAALVAEFADELQASAETFGGAATRWLDRYGLAAG
jgi:hypothetical protein